MKKKTFNYFFKWSCAATLKLLIREGRARNTGPSGSVALGSILTVTINNFAYVTMP